MKGTELTLGMHLHRHCQPCSQNLFAVFHLTGRFIATSDLEVVLHASGPEDHRASSLGAALHASAHGASNAAVAAVPARNRPCVRGPHLDNGYPTSLADASLRHPNNIHGYRDRRYAMTSQAC